MIIFLKNLESFIIFFFQGEEECCEWGWRC